MPSDAAVNPETYWQGTWPAESRDRKVLSKTFTRSPFIVTNSRTKWVTPDANVILRVSTVSWPAIFEDGVTENALTPLVAPFVVYHV